MKTIVTMENPVSGHIESATCDYHPLVIARVILQFSRSQRIDPLIVEVLVSEVHM